METTRRHLLNAYRDFPGSIAETMKTYSLAPIANDGAHHCGNTRVPPKESGPWQSNKEINIPLCSDNWDITEFENSYIHLDVNLKLRFAGFDRPNTFDDYDPNNTTLPPRPPNYHTAQADVTADNNYDRAYRNLARKILWENQYVFFGLKCSNHVIRNYSFKFHDQPVSSTIQSSAIYEHFLYSNFKAKSEIENKKYVFTDYNEVSKLDNSICGAYIPLSQILRHGTDSNYDLRLELIIPFNELLALEAFKEYPNRLFGELKVVITCTGEGFVHTEVNPIDSIRKGIISGKIDRKDENTKLATSEILSEIFRVDPDTIDYLHAFQQVGLSSQAQYIVDYLPRVNNEQTHLIIADTPNFTIYVDDFRTNDTWADVRGYKISDECYNALVNHFGANPFTICAQKIETYSFPGGPTDRQLSQTMNIRLNRVTDFELLMPQHSAQRTVFRNPALNNFQLLVGFWRGPDQLISTLSPEFFTQQIQATDFDTQFVATDAFEHSLSEARVDENGLKNPTTDDTSFVPIWSVERANAEELVFDGMDNQAIKIEINGVPYFTKRPELNIYGSGCPAPILCCCSDTYWIFRLVDGYPNCQYITQTTYEDAYEHPNIEACKPYNSGA